MPDLCECGHVRHEVACAGWDPGWNEVCRCPLREPTPDEEWSEEGQWPRFYR